MRIIEKPVESARGRIWGELILPDAMPGVPDAPLPLVIYSHGFDADADHALKFADAITGAGLALYTFDFRGGSQHSRSAGSPLAMSVLTECTDLTEVIDALARDPRVDPENVFLFGASFGGLVSALVAARMPERIRGLASTTPPSASPTTSAPASPLPQTCPRRSSPSAWTWAGASPPTPSSSTPTP